MFNRSDDGGETWAVAEYALPYAEEAYGIDFGCFGMLSGCCKR